MVRPIVSQLVIDEFTKLVDSQDKIYVELSEIRERNQKLEHELNGYIIDVEVMEGMLHQANNRLVETRKEISHLKTLSRVSKCLQLEQDNLVLAKENAKLKGLLL